MKTQAKRKIYWIDPRLSSEEYDRQWIANVLARCVVNENGCWIWTRFCHQFRNIKPGQRGYPAASYRGKNCRVHRKMLELKLGRILPVTLHACHTCDTPPCCNPDHLYSGTNQQNHLDGAAKGRMQGQWKTQCDRGHEYNAENTYMQPRPGGGIRRSCRLCQKISHSSPGHVAWRRAYQRKRRALKREQLAGDVP